MGTIIGSVINPLTLSPAIWIDFADASTVSLSGSSITQVTDKSGNGKTLTQGTAARRPTYSTASQNGLNTASFDGGDSLAASTAADWTFLHNGTNYIMAMALRPGTTANPDTFYTLWATNDLLAATHGAGIFWDDRSSLSRNNRIAHRISRNAAALAVENVSADNVMTANAYSAFSLLAQPSNATAALRSSIIVNNGTAQANNALTNAPSASAPVGAITIGAAVNGTTGPLVGNICEFIIVSGANATDANAQRLTEYLRNKWGI